MIGEDSCEKAGKKGQEQCKEHHVICFGKKVALKVKRCREMANES
jgi:hypothetical protein